MKEYIERNNLEQGPKGGRDLNTYEEILNFKREELINKLVLDLGAGPGGKLSKELAEAGINTDVVSLSPEYASEKYSKEFKLTYFEKLRRLLPEKLRHLLRLPEVAKQHLAIAAEGENLPFIDSSFDKVLALFSVSTWSEANYREWLPEIMRVLKDEGDARIGPFRLPKLDVASLDRFGEFESHREMKEYVASLGYNFEFIPGPIKGQEVLIIHKK